MGNLSFPEDFIWGTAASAYQTEGNNFNCDWYGMEQRDLKNPPEKRRFKEPCGLACDHWNRFEEDFELAARLGIRMHRLSIEWSRVFPEMHRADAGALEHYRRMIAALKRRGIAVMLTLHHFTIPLWMERQGGYEKRAVFMKHFREYVEAVVSALGDLVDCWLPINEPNVVPLGGYLTGAFPPYRTSPLAFVKVYRTFFDMHASCYHIIKRRFPHATVGVAFAFIHLQPYDEKKAIDRLAARFANLTANLRFFQGITSGRVGFPLGVGASFPSLRGTLDFVGLNYYSTTYIRGLFGVEQSREGDLVTDMGWVFYPQGIYEVLKYLGSAVRLPIIVTENGVATTDESFRIRYMEAHLGQVHRAMAEGVPVRGYMCWSLTDNFEWDRGYAMRFGLVHVDFSTQERRVKEGGEWFSRVIRNGGL